MASSSRDQGRGNDSRNGGGYRGNGDSAYRASGSDRTADPYTRSDRKTYVFFVNSNIYILDLFLEDVAHRVVAACVVCRKSSVAAMAVCYEGGNAPVWCVGPLRAVGRGDEDLCVRSHVVF